MQNSKEFLNYVIKRCKTRGITVFLGKGKKVRCDGVLTSGFFDDVNKVLAVAMGNDNYLNILAHEFCHFKQWDEQCPIWVKAVKSKSYENFWKYISKKKCKDPIKNISICRDLELDCEKRVVDLIKEHDLPINVKEYIQKANAYVYFYNWMKTTKRWCKPNNTPYSNERLVSAMPTHFNNDYSFIPDKLLKIYKEENI